MPGFPAPYRVVFDTNVLLSLFVFVDSRFAPFLDELAARRWIALTSAPCLAEFQRVLTYPLFALDSQCQQAAYAAYLALAEQVDALPLPIALPKCRDKDDQKFLELARDGRADWLVSADKLVLKLRRGGRLDDLFRIRTPDETLLDCRRPGALDLHANPPHATGNADFGNGDLDPGCMKFVEQ
jgi:putative PIN family toxin of toxin-antitoxin system